MNVSRKSAANCKTLVLALVALATSAMPRLGLAAADEPATSAPTSENSEQRPDPIAGVSRLGLEDWFTPTYHGEEGRGNDLVFRGYFSFRLATVDTVSRL